MGPEFEPYLPVVMPPLVNAAGTKADISVYGTCYLIIHPAVVHCLLQMKMSKTSQSGKVGRPLSSMVKLWAFGHPRLKRNVKHSKHSSYTVRRSRLGSHH